jgi:DNA-binding transcriptional regulator YiaG
MQTEATHLHDGVKPLPIAPLQPITPADMVAIRNARNWKRSNLADYLGCDYTTVWRMENGKAGIEGASLRLLNQLKTEQQRSVTP